MILVLFLGEIRELCGCDLLTISPKLLGELQESSENTPAKLSEAEGELYESSYFSCEYSAIKIQTRMFQK